MLPKRDRLPSDDGTLAYCRVRTCQGMSHLNMERICLNGELIVINEELIDLWCLIIISHDLMDNRKIA